MVHLALSLWTISFCSDSALEPLKDKPNVILIVADDLGYGELGCYGGKEIPTPNIDSIAKNGVRLTDGYVSCPVCAPTRAGLMTGRYGPRFGFEFNPGPQQQASSEFGLPKSEKTIAERLKALGYATGMVGKWHLGYDKALTPPNRGFDSFFGFLGGAHAYQGNRRGGSILRGGERVSEPMYLTYALGREATGFIDANKNRPFFLYLPFNAVHAPLQAPARLEDRMKPYKDAKRRTFAGMLMAMDDVVGDVLSALKKAALDKDTIIVFIADNGGPTPQTTSSNVPLRGFKAQTWEGGIRIPYMFQWPGHLPAGGTYSRPAISLDITPTILAAIGSPVPRSEKLDGVNLLPYLSAQKKGLPHEALYWRYGPQSAIRMGDWKLVTANGASDGLFNLKDDISEKNDLSQREPGRVKALKSAWEKWSGQLMRAKWGGRGKDKED